MSDNIANFGILEDARLKFKFFESSEWINKAELKSNFFNVLFSSLVLWLLISNDSKNTILSSNNFEERADFKANNFSYVDLNNITL